MNSKRYLAGLLALLLTFTLTGCWDTVELNRRAIVVAAGLDKAVEGNGVAITVQLLKPGEVKAPGAGGRAAGGGGGGEAVEVVTSTGQTVYDAVRNFVAESGRKLFWHHNEVIVFSEDLARQGVSPLLDFFRRNAEARAHAKFIIARGAKGRDVMAARTRLEKIPGQGLSKLLEAGRAATSAHADVELLDFLKTLSGESGGAVASGVEISPGEGGMGPVARPTGAAVFKEDRLVGWLGPRETRGYLWIKGNVKSGIIVVKCPGEGDKLASIEIIRAKAKVRPEVKEGRLVMTVHVDARANVGELMGLVDPAKPDVLSALEREMRVAIESEVSAALKAAQKEYRSDIFGFGDEINRRFPREWKTMKERWDELYPELPVDVTVKAKLKQTALATKPVKS